MSCGKAAFQRNMDKKVYNLFVVYNKFLNFCVISVEIFNQIGYYM